MKTLLFLLALMFTLPSFALTRPEIEALLRAKGQSLSRFESMGMSVFMGEVTGHLPFAKVVVLLTEHEAILKSEIEGASFNGAQTLGALESVRFNGQYVQKEDVKATIAVK